MKKISFTHSRLQPGTLALPGFRFVAAFFLAAILACAFSLGVGRADGIGINFVGTVYNGTGLDGVHSVAVSPDGSYLYTAGSDDDAVAVFSRNPSTGSLSFVEVHRDGVGGVDGLDGVDSVTVSPDGSHLYASGRHEDALAVFSRNPSTGSLTFVEVQKDGVGGVDGLDGPESVTVSPDGSHLYAAGSSDNAVAVFSRNPSTGALTFVEMQQDGVGGVDGLAGAASVAVSPSGSHLYAAGQLDDGVAVFSRNPSTGSLTFVEMLKDGVGAVDGLDGANSVTVTPDGSHVYAAGHFDDAVAVFSRNPSTGSLTFVEVQRDGAGGVDGLDSVRSVTVSPDGSHLYASGYFDNGVAVFSRNPSIGSLTFVEMQQDGVGGVDGLRGVQSVTVSPDGNNLYAAGYEEDAVAIFSRNPSSGSLNIVEAQRDGVGAVDGLDGALSVTVSPDGSHLYAAGRDDDAVAVFSRNPSTGNLTFVEMQKDGVGGVDGLDGVWSVTVSSDGSHLYAAGALDDSVAVFSRNASSGRLTFVEMQKDGVGGVDGLAAVVSVTLSPDGSHLYAAGLNDDGVAVFSRNASSGRLTFVEVQKDGVDGVDGLAGATSVTVSPDGSHLYAAGFHDDGVAVFSRNASTGSLTFVEMQKDGAGGVDGLDGVQSVTVSPDGSHLYAAGANDDGVAVFSRNASTGSLSFVEVQQDGVAGVDGLAGVQSVTVSPDGSHLYAAGGHDDAVAVFSRNASTGSLTFVEAQKDGVGGVNGLVGVVSVTVSPDGSHLYAAGFDDDAVAIFHQTVADLALTKTVDPANAQPGDTITYTLAFTNTGPALAESVVISDSVPVSVTVTGVTSSTVGSGVLITERSGGPDFGWTVSDLAVGAGGYIILTGRLSNSASLLGTTITNTATISASNDNNTLNNSASAAIEAATSTESEERLFLPRIGRSEERLFLPWLGR